MGTHIAMIIEGATERALREPLTRFLRDRVPRQMPRLDFVPMEGRWPRQDALRDRVERLLRGNDAVIALADVAADVRPDGRVNPAETRARMRRWVGARERRFHPHVAAYEFEAWLLPYWSKVQRLAGSNEANPLARPEAMRPESRPSQRLREVFRAGSKRRDYCKLRDATAILDGEDLSVAAAHFPELKALLNTMLLLCDGAPI